MMIPAMANPIAGSWRQPSRDEILVDDTYAAMSQKTFDSLQEYSCSVPSGVYPGKMWKRHDALFDRNSKPENRLWLLCWFSESEYGPELCAINLRRVLIV